MLRRVMLRLSRSSGLSRPIWALFVLAGAALAAAAACSSDEPTLPSSSTGGTRGTATSFPSLPGDGAEEPGGTPRTRAEPNGRIVNGFGGGRGSYGGAGALVDGGAEDAGVATDGGEADAT